MREAHSVESRIDGSALHCGGSYDPAKWKYLKVLSMERVVQLMQCCRGAAQTVPYSQPELHFQGEPYIAMVSHLLLTVVIPNVILTAVAVFSTLNTHYLSLFVFTAT